MIKLITWKMDRSHEPADPAERMKHTMAMCEMVKKGMEKGGFKMWGMNPGGNHGFAVTDLDEKQIFAGNARYIPHVIFNVEPMLDIDEVISTLTEMQK
jgi:hypothetical protein